MKKVQVLFSPFCFILQLILSFDIDHCHRSSRMQAVGYTSTFLTSNQKITKGKENNGIYGSSHNTTIKHHLSPEKNKTANIANKNDSKR